MPVNKLLPTTVSFSLIILSFLPHDSLTYSLALRRRHRPLCAYGRGAEIWPPPSDEPIALTDSFPNGILPPEATSPELLPDITPPGRKWKRLLPKSISRILTRAAAAQEEEFFDVTIQPIDKSPGLVALSLLLLGCVQPLDVLLVAFLSGYFIFLGVLSKSVRSDGITPFLPALPPQGHVPLLVSNPLGPELAYSISYDRWLKLGVGLGFLGPFLLSLKYVFSQQQEAARLVLRPLFWLCCQAVSEAVSKRFQTPLPLRILVPVSYNTVRLGYLWNWTASAVDSWGRGLGVLNLMYWGMNLFAFLLPVAVLRYMRAHFLCVEAEQATTRTGLEETIGLLS